MEPISLVVFKQFVAGERCDIVSDTLWSPVVKVLNANLFVNVNDRYLILYNDDFEIHISCVAGVYKDNDSYIIEKQDVFDRENIEKFIITRHKS